jgi:hypothetical protein
MSGCSAFVPLVEPAAAPASETTAEDAARPAQEAAAPAPAESQAEAEEADDSWVKPADSSEAAPASSGTDTVAEPVPFKNEQQRNGLNAGEVDDNEKWDDYLSYRRNYTGPAIHDRDISERYVIDVVDGQGYPVMDAHVQIFIEGAGQSLYEAYTYANGQVLFHPQTMVPMIEQTSSFLVVASKDNAVAKFSMPRFNSQQGNQAAEHWTAELDLRQQFDTINLDVLFLLDATGSMADEINAIQTTIFDVADRIDQLPGRQDVRFGLVAYRDRGDEYVTRTFDFEADVRDFSDNLERIEANGGGDYPEALNEGLQQALYNVQWRVEGTVRLFFMIADAPPHLDYGKEADYAVDMETAASSAIKIFPIASSGLDDQGEYVFRQLAQFTQGRFIFLTYDSPSNGGQSGDITTHHVDSYSVNTLDDLLVRLVTEELAFQNPELVQGQ